MSTVSKETPRKRKQTTTKSVNSSKKRRKSLQPLQEAANDEHAQLLGFVTGQMRKLPLDRDVKIDSRKEVVSEEKQDCNDGEGKRGSSGVDKQAALEYLSMWDTNRQMWSFKKKIQYWLLQNMYDKEEVSKPNFKIMLQYLDGLQGNQRGIVQERAKEIVTEHESKSDPEAKRKHKRATKILKVLTSE